MKMQSSGKRDFISEWAQWFEMNFLVKFFIIYQFVLQVSSASPLANIRANQE